MAWLAVKLTKFNLPQKYVLLVPGSSKKGMVKRWPASSYINLAKTLIIDRITPILIGGKDEEEILQEIETHVPLCMNLCHQTNLLEIGGLAQQAIATIGNDTGAVHLSAAVGCPTLVLWSNFSSPDIFAPRGLRVRIIYRENLSTLPVAAVYKEFQNFISTISFAS